MVPARGLCRFDDALARSDSDTREKKSIGAAVPQATVGRWRYGCRQHFRRRFSACLGQKHEGEPQLRKSCRDQYRAPPQALCYTHRPSVSVPPTLLLRPSPMNTSSDSLPGCVFRPPWRQSSARTHSGTLRYAGDRCARDGRACQRLRSSRTPRVPSSRGGYDPYRGPPIRNRGLPGLRICTPSTAWISRGRCWTLDS